MAARVGAWEFMVGVAAAIPFAAMLPSSARAADDPLTFLGSLSWINAWTEQSVDNGSVLNPGNKVAAVPHDEGVSEFRPNLKVTTSNLQLIARPRIRYTYDEIKVAGHERDPAGTTSDTFNEAYVQWTVNENVSFAYGRQNYQWGAAELISPSNRIFHETAQERTVLFEEPGLDLARVNFSVGKQFTTVLMVEDKDNTDIPTFQADVPFAPVGLAKSEYTWHEGTDYVGLVAGGREHGVPWGGAYFNYALPFFDGLSLFGDGSAQHGSEAWYPVTHAVPTQAGVHQVVTFDQSQILSGKTYAMVVGGLKYDFVNGAILRGEYFLNQAGYSKDEYDSVLRAAPSRDPLQVQALPDDYRRFAAPGLELIGQRYAYVSLHFPDLFTVRDLALEARGLRALDDGTTYGYGSLDYKVGDSGTATLAAAGTGGRQDGELKGFASPQYTVAYRHDW